MPSNPSGLERYCLVTVGATVGFPDLIRNVLQPSFWEFLRSQDFTALRVQCGPDIAWAADLHAQRKDELPHGFRVDVFDARRNLLKEEMMLCQARQGQRAPGLVISHAGTGTILDAWRLDLPLVVIPNTGLLDDHQTEMARHLDREGYAVMSSANVRDLQESIRKAVLLWEENRTTRWPAHDVRRSRNQSGALRLWDIKPGEAKGEDVSQMSHD